MVGRTNAAVAVDTFELEVSTDASIYYNTNIPVAGVKRIVLQYWFTDFDGVKFYISELNTVNDDGTLTQEYAINYASNGSVVAPNFRTSIFIIDGMIHVEQRVTQRVVPTRFYVAVYR